MILKFFARGDKLVNDPRRGARDNQPVHRVNRKFVRGTVRDLGDGKGTMVTETPASYPALPEPYEIDSESQAGQRLAKMVRDDHRNCDPCLWPADEATAKYLDVPFVKTKFVDGEHVADVAPAKPASGGKKAAE